MLKSPYEISVSDDLTTKLFIRKNQILNETKNNVRLKQNSNYLNIKKDDILTSKRIYSAKIFGLGSTREENRQKISIFQTINKDNESFLKELNSISTDKKLPSNSTDKKLPSISQKKDLKNNIIISKSEQKEKIESNIIKNNLSRKSESPTNKYNLIPKSPNYNISFKKAVEKIRRTIRKLIMFNLLYKNNNNIILKKDLNFTIKSFSLTGKMKIPQERKKIVKLLVYTEKVI